MTSTPGVQVESAIVALIPEAEAVMDGWPRTYDPQESSPVPAHVTFIYPFLRPDEIDDAVLAKLRDHFAEEPPLEVDFRGIAGFRRTLYLVPEPQEAIVALIGRLLAHYPELRPYGGAFAELIPHLTVAHTNEVSELDAILEQCCRATAEKLPIHATIRQASLLQTDARGRWCLRRHFPFKR